MSAENVNPAAARYALALADDALILAQRLSEWSSCAPEIEEDLALTNVGLDLLGQARSLLEHAGELEGDGRTADDLAFLRGEREFLNHLIVELPNGDFGQTIARQLLFSTYQLSLYEGLERSSDELLAGVAGKAVKEVVYHRDYARLWTLRLGDGTAESHDRMQAALEYVWPFADELFRDDKDTLALMNAGIAVDSASLREEWETFIHATLTEATLTIPETNWRPEGGRDGRHTENLGFLLAEMQSLHRSLPGVEW